MSFFVYQGAEIGKSHINKNIPLQDSLKTYKSSGNSKIIGCVSDGHGSELHFNSQFGSDLLCKVLINSLKLFIDKLEKNICIETYKNSPIECFEFGIKQEYNTEIPEHKKLYNDLNHHFQHLFKNIILKWNEQLEKHWKENKPSREELKNKGISDEWVESFINDEKVEVAYGCTLVTFVITSNYFFSFQLGDGSCIVFDKNLNSSNPLPSDPKCIGNTTTSMCEEDALNNIRYVFQVKNIPKSVFIATDGLDGAFSLIDEIAFERLNAFYKKVIMHHEEKGEKQTKKELDLTMKKFANDGVKLDDIAFVCAIEKNSK